MFCWEPEVSSKINQPNHKASKESHGTLSFLLVSVQHMFGMWDEEEKAARWVEGIGGEGKKPIHERGWIEKRIS